MVSATHFGFVSFRVRIIPLSVSFRVRIIPLSVSFHVRIIPFFAPLRAQPILLPVHSACGSFYAPPQTVLQADHFTASF